MKDRFENWDRFYRHFKLTGDPHKALRWLRYELWAKKRRDQALTLHARHQVALSLHPTPSAALSKTTRD